MSLEIIFPLQYMQQERLLIFFFRFKGTRMHADKKGGEMLRGKVELSTSIHWSYRYEIIYGGGKWDKKEICNREGRRHRCEKEGTEKQRWRCGERRKRRDDVDKGAYARERDSGSESVGGLKGASTEENPKDDHGGTMKRAASARRRGMQLLFIPRRNRSDS